MTYPGVTPRQGRNVFARPSSGLSGHLWGKQLKSEGWDGYVPQVRVVSAVFYAELFNLWSHLSNKFGQFFCSFHCLCVNYKTKQLLLVSSELPLTVWTS